MLVSISTITSEGKDQLIHSKFKFIFLLFFISYGLYRKVIIKSMEF